MSLLSNWKQVLRYAWSIRLIVLAGILSGMEVALPIIDEFVELPRGLFAGLSLLVVGGAFIARLVAQSNIGDKE